MDLVTISPALFASALDIAYEQTRCRDSFLYFLTTLTIHDDDPIRPSSVPFHPYPYQVERGRAWETGQSEVNLKARQLGFSWLAAAYKLWRAAYHGWSIAYISKGQVEARAHLESRVRFMWRHLGGRSATRWTADSVEFDSGGSIRVFPSTPDAGVQYTFQLVIFDEFAFHQFGVANWAAILPTLSAGGQVLVMSTADPDLGSAGAFYDVWSQAEQGLNGLTPVFTEVLERPGRDVAWLERERARIGDSTRADAFYPRTAAMAFVGRSGLVFPMFSKERHVTEYHRIAWQQAYHRIAGVDFGGGDPTAVVPLAISKDWTAHQPAELYRRGGVSSDDVCQWLYVLHGIAPFERIVVDAGSGTATVVTQMQLSGLPVFEAEKSPAARRSIQGWFLEENRLTIHQGCTNSIAEFAGYRWTERVDPNSKERYKVSTPVDHHGDAIDARGYALQEAVSRWYGGGAIIPAYRMDFGQTERGPQNWRERVEMTREMRQ